jgi:putative heme transporter
MDAGAGGGPDGEDQRPEREPRPGRFLRGLLNIALIVVSVAGLAWLLATQHDQLGRAIAGVAHAKLRTVVAAVLCERVSMVAFARVQVRLLRAGGQRLSLRSAISILIAGNALSLSVPIAGPGLAVAFIYRELDRREIRHPVAAFALVMSGVLSTVSLMLILAAGLLASGNTVAAALGLLSAAGIAVGIVAILFALRVQAWRRWLERMAARGVALAQRLRRKAGDPPEEVVARALRQLAELHLRRRDWAMAGLMTVLNWLGDAACLELSIRAVGLAVPLRDVLLVWSVGQAAGGISITPGGVGVVEAALVAALVGVHAPAAKAAVAVLIYRLISLWLLLLIGWVFFAVLRVRARRRSADR